MTIPMDEKEPEAGGRKKFLYSGSVANKRQRQEDEDWTFGSKPTAQTSAPQNGLSVNLDNVWSIRNVSLGTTATSVRSEPVSFKPEVLTKTAQSSFYSRHGGMNGKNGNGAGDSQENSKMDKSSLWSSSGHKLGSSSHRPFPPTFQNPSDKAFKNSLSRKQNPSPFDYDMNDF